MGWCIGALSLSISASVIGGSGQGGGLASGHTWSKITTMVLLTIAHQPDREPAQKQEREDADGNVLSLKTMVKNKNTKNYVIFAMFKYSVFM